MEITVLKTKLHQACVTHAELEYDGSCAIDGALLDKAGIHEYEQIDIYNITNGERFTTYAIRAKENSRIISVNGAAAHKANPSDRVIICAYARINENEINQFKPTLVYLDVENKIIRIKDHIPVQAA
ncbi:aspartate 1-decarboxylase [bacterium]|jgi:aspartate 1-decarboxylase|nr:aspartate 1-decarboxylase [bacterium]|tara:strand:+ start:144 stop:524 length:381 start_codon:yes stop_codon:yes gene_type:complete